MTKKQKQIISFLLCIVFVVSFSFFFFSMIKDKNQQVNSSKPEFVNQNVIHCDDHLSNLSFHGYTVLIVGYSGCTTCDELKNGIRVPPSIHSHTYYLDITKSKKHELVAQALRTSGFPTIYLIDENCRIKSIIKGSTNYEFKLASSLTSKVIMDEEHLGVTGNDKVFGMLSASLQAVLALNNENYDDVFQYASKSLSYGSYFFNNWLMHSYYKYENKKDSTELYQFRSLKYTDGANSIIYSTLIEVYDENTSKK